MVQVNFYAAAREAAGSSTLMLPIASLANLIAELNSRDERFKKLLPTCSYLINGEAVQDLNRTLKDHDSVDVLPQFAGG